MKLRSWKRRMRNGLLVICDPESRESPDVDGLAPYWQTEHCLLVPCQHRDFGPVTITAGDMNEIARTDHEIFDGVIVSPSGTLALETVYLERIALIETGVERNHVRVWGDGYKDTLFLNIGIAPAP